MEEESFLCAAEEEEGVCREEEELPAPNMAFLSLFFCAIVSSIRFLADLCRIFFAEASTSYTKSRSSMLASFSDLACFDGDV